MDQDTSKEVSSRKSNLDAGYAKIRDVWASGEAIIEQEIRKNQGERKFAFPNAILNLFRIDSHNTRLVLEWSKESMDAIEDAIEPTLKRINNFLDLYTPLLERWKAEQENLSRKVKEIGPR